MMENNLIKLNLTDKIYEIRGQKVMLDFELAEIYGYSTGAFTQQVARNIEKFDEDFYFQLADDEWKFLRSKNLTSNNRGEDAQRSKNLTFGPPNKEILKSKNLASNNESGEVLISQNVISNNRGDEALISQNVISKGRGGRQKPPHAFTEQGIYMLMTVLKGDLATRQSKALIRAFKQMKDYLIANQGQIPSQEFIALSNRVSENTSDIKNLALEQAELKTVITSFIEADKKVEKLLLDGKYVDADFVYAGIYNTAKKSIIIIDNYIGLRTLVLLKDIRKGVKCTIYTSKSLYETELEDFKKQYPNINIEIKTGKTKNIHDRFIVIDKNTENEKIYHCGGSSKDAGNKKTVISELKITDELKKALRI